jgi:hypothetical protein
MSIILFGVQKYITHPHQIEKSHCNMRSRFQAVESTARFFQPEKTN